MFELYSFVDNFVTRHFWVWYYGYEYDVLRLLWALIL